MAALVTARPTAAQGADPGSGKVAYATRLSGTAPRIDGHLDEAAWASAGWLSDFRQKDPVEGGVPTDSTSVAFLYDDDALYVGARLLSGRVRDIPRAVTRRDQFSNAEYFIVSLDPYHDKRTGYSFSVSSGGVQGDSYHPEDSEDNRDPAFNPVWESHISFDSLGWYVEMRIPFSQLRFNRQTEQEWGLNINRWRPAFNEDIYWVVISRTLSGFFSRFGTLRGMDDIRPRRSPEFIPYVAGSGDFNATRQRGNPFDDGSVTTARAGGDVKLGLGQSLTLDATLNPDFGQVEADPAEVNLSAFETFFPEQRPFFIEGNKLLEGNGPDYYYSRRIGAAPRGSPTGAAVDSAAFVSTPRSATILGAAKVTGRTGSGLSIGALAALTKRAYATTYNAASGAFDRVAVDPLSAYGVTRIQQELGRSASTIGVTLTGLTRSFADAAPLALQLTDKAFSGGTDWLLRLNDGEYQIRGHAGFSYVHGSPEAVARVQRSSARYYQRPDKRYALLDTTRTSLAGYSVGLSAEKAGGTHWTGYLGAVAESPGFEINDVGRLRSADDIDVEGVLNYRENTAGALFRRYRVGVYTGTGWNFGGTRKYSIFRVNTSQTWLNWWNSALSSWYRPAGMSDDLTRGGPLMGVGAEGGVDARLFSNEANPIQGGGRLSSSWGEFGQSRQSAGVFLNARPGGRWQLSLSPSWQHSVDPRQYVTAVTGGTAATYGTRYIFARVDQTTLSMQLRLNYAFTPELTLEVYAEPFAASGDYTNYGELTAARASTLRIYGTDNTTIVREADGNYTVTDGNGAQVFALENGSFNVLSYRSNVVFRWEWRPGSTLFFIWQQNRSSYCSAGFDSGSCYQRDATPGSGVRLGDLVATRSVPGDNLVAIKASYWFTLH